MRISDLVSVLNDMKEIYGDKIILDMDSSFPFPREMEVTLIQEVEGGVGNVSYNGSDELLINIELNFDEQELFDRGFKEKKEF